MTSVGSYAAGVRKPAVGCCEVGKDTDQNMIKLYPTIWDDGRS